MATEEDRMRMELQRMQRRADEVTDDSLESTRRILKMAEETQDSGIKTLVALDEQGEKLNRIEENLDEINDGMKEAERNLTGLEKFCGLCVCSCRRRKNFEKTEEYRKAYGGGHKGNSNDTAARTSAQGGTSSSNGQKTGYIKRVTNDAREDEMDENLGKVDDIVGNLKSMAVDMGTEIDRQNHQIGRITDKTNANEIRIDHANKRAENILRN